MKMEHVWAVEFFDINNERWVPQECFLSRINARASVISWKKVVSCPVRIKKYVREDETMDMKLDMVNFASKLCRMDDAND
jgi:hypothetical protein